MRYLLLLVSVTLLSACVYENAVSTTEPVDYSMAYVYGRFALSGGEGTDIALVMSDSQEEDADVQNEKLIRFKSVNPVYAIAVPPGTYYLGQLAYLNKNGYAQFYKYISKEDKMMVPVTLEAGKAYYIGDYYGESNMTYENYGRYKLSWKMKKIQDKFGTTTTELLEEYTKFGSIKRINLFRTFQLALIKDEFNDLVSIEELIKRKEYSEAYRKLLAIKHKNIPHAQYLMGYLFENGYGVQKNYIKAGELYKQAAEKRYANAMFAFGMLLMRHSKKALRGVPEAHSESDQNWEDLGSRLDGYNWLQKAARHGESRAMIYNCMFASDRKAPASMRLSGQAWCKLAVEFIPTTNTKLRGMLAEQMKGITETVELNKLVAEYRSRIEANRRIND